MKSKQFSIDMNYLDQMLEFIREETSEIFGPNDRSTYKILTAVDEALTNIILYSGLSSKKMLTISCQQTHPPGIEIILEDEGFPYNPTDHTIPKPEDTLTIEQRDPGGFGIFLMGKLMDRVDYRYENKKNILKLTKFY